MNKEVNKTSTFKEFGPTEPKQSVRKNGGETRTPTSELGHTTTALRIKPLPSGPATKIFRVCHTGYGTTPCFSRVHISVSVVNVLPKPYTHNNKHNNKNNSELRIIFSGRQSLRTISSARMQPVPPARRPVRQSYMNCTLASWCGRSTPARRGSRITGTRQLQRHRDTEDNQRSQNMTRSSQGEELRRTVNQGKPLTNAQSRAHGTVPNEREDSAYVASGCCSTTLFSVRV